MVTVARDAASIGNAVRRSRKALKWSQQVLASRAGLRQETISLIETGNPATRVDTLLSILAALNLEFQIAPSTLTSKREAGLF